MPDRSLTPDDEAHACVSHTHRLPPLTSPRAVTVTFSDPSTSSRGAITSWWWDFGDGAFGSTQQHPAHFYARPGVYGVTLTASTGTNTNTKQKQDYIVIGPQHRTVINYTYDGLYRLTQASSSGALTTTFQCAYDPVGNRTAQTATITSTVVTAYQYDAANRLTNAVSVNYTWNDNPTPLRCGDFAVIWSTIARRRIPTIKRTN